MHFCMRVNEWRKLPNTFERLKQPETVAWSAVLVFEGVLS